MITKSIRTHKKLGESTHLWAAAVTHFVSLPNAVSTNRVSHDHSGFVVKATSQATVVQSTVQVVDAALAPLGGGGKPRDSCHDAVARGVLAVTAPSYGREVEVCVRLGIRLQGSSSKRG